MARHLGKHRGKTKQHHAHADKGRQREADRGFPAPAAEQDRNSQSAEKEGVKNEVILGHQTGKNRETDPEFFLPRRGAQFPGNQQRQQHGEERHQHIHPNHQHGAEPDLTEAVERRKGSGDQTIAEELHPEDIEQRQQAKINQEVRNQPDPLGELPSRQRRAEVEKPVIERGMNVLNLVVVDGSHIEARL